MKKLVLILVVLLAMVAAGCSGGGSSSNNEVCTGANCDPGGDDPGGGDDPAAPALPLELTEWQPSDPIILGQEGSKKDLIWIRLPKNQRLTGEIQLSLDPTLSLNFSSIKLVKLDGNRTLIAETSFTNGVAYFSIDIESPAGDSLGMVFVGIVEESSSVPGEDFATVTGGINLQVENLESGETWSPDQNWLLAGKNLKFVAQEGVIEASLNEDSPIVPGEDGTIAVFDFTGDGEITNFQAWAKVSGKGLDGVSFEVWIDGVPIGAGKMLSDFADIEITVSSPCTLVIKSPELISKLKSGDTIGLYCADITASKPVSGLPLAAYLVTVP